VHSLRMFKLNATDYSVASFEPRTAPEDKEGEESGPDDDKDGGEGGRDDVELADGTTGICK